MTSLGRHYRPWFACGEREGGKEGGREGGKEGRSEGRGVKWFPVVEKAAAPVTRLKPPDHSGLPGEASRLRRNTHPPTPQREIIRSSAGELTRVRRLLKSVPGWRCSAGRILATPFSRKRQEETLKTSGCLTRRICLRVMCVFGEVRLCVSLNSRTEGI